MSNRKPGRARARDGQFKGQQQTPYSTGALNGMLAYELSIGSRFWTDAIRAVPAAAAAHVDSLRPEARFMQSDPCWTAPCALCGRTMISAVRPIKAGTVGCRAPERCADFARALAPE